MWWWQRWSPAPTAGPTVCQDAVASWHVCVCALVGGLRFTLKLVKRGVQARGCRCNVPANFLGRQFCGRSRSEVRWPLGWPASGPHGRRELSLFWFCVGRWIAGVDDVRGQWQGWRISRLETCGGPSASATAGSAEDGRGGTPGEAANPEHIRAYVQPLEGLGQGACLPGPDLEIRRRFQGANLIVWASG